MTKVCSIQNQINRKIVFQYFVMRAKKQHLRLRESDVLRRDDMLKLSANGKMQRD